MSVSYDLYLSAPYQEDGPEEPSDHDLYMEAVMADDVCPHLDTEHVLHGDRVVDEVCTGCGVLASKWEVAA